MKKLALPIVLALLLAVPAAVLAEGDDWILDFDKAVEIAKKEKKLLLVDFSGSNWCGWCTRLHEDIFKFDSFLKAAKQDYVLVYLDFPQVELPGGKEAMAKIPNFARNEELRDKYHIRGYPTVLLLTPEGEVIGRTGYRRGGPENYVAHLKELKEAGLKALAETKALVKAYEDAKGEERVRAFEEVLSKFEGMERGAVGSEALGAVIEGALEGAKEDTRVRIVKALLGAGRVDETVKSAVMEIDPKNEQGLYEQWVEAYMGTISSKEQLKDAVKVIEAYDALGKVHDKQVALRLCINAAFWNHKFLNNPEAAKKWALRAKELGAADNPRLKPLLDQILGS